MSLVHGFLSVTTALAQTAYAKWLSDRAHVAPIEQHPLEQPMDLLAHVAPIHAWELPMELQVHSAGLSEPGAGHNEYTIEGTEWRAGRDSNPRPSGSKPGEQPDASLKRLRMPPRTPQRRVRRGLAGTM